MSLASLSLTEYMTGPPESCSGDCSKLMDAQRSSGSLFDTARSLVSSTSARVSPTSSVFGRASTNPLKWGRAREGGRSSEGWRRKLYSFKSSETPQSSGATTLGLRNTAVSMSPVGGAVSPRPVGSRSPKAVEYRRVCSGTQYTRVRRPTLDSIPETLEDSGAPLSPR